MIEFSSRRFLRRIRWVIFLSTALVLAACSYVYELHVTVVPGEQVGTEAIVDVSVIIAKAPHQPSQLSSMAAIPINEDGFLTTEICCTPNPEIWIYAFHDVNGSGIWDSDEPLVADSSNPVRLTADYSTTFNMP